MTIVNWHWLKKWDKQFQQLQIQWRVKLLQFSVYRLCASWSCATNARNSLKNNLLLAHNFVSEQPVYITDVLWNAVITLQKHHVVSVSIQPALNLIDLWDNWMMLSHSLYHYTSVTRFTLFKRSFLVVFLNAHGIS